MNELVGVLLGAVVAWSVINVAELVIDVAFRLARRRRASEFDSDHAEARALLAAAHASQLQLGEMVALARAQVDEIARLTDAARHSSTTRTSAIPKVPKPPGPPGGPAAY